MLIPDPSLSMKIIEYLYVSHPDYINASLIARKCGFTPSYKYYQILRYLEGKEILNVNKVSRRNILVKLDDRYMEKAYHIYITNLLIRNMQ